MLRGQNSKVKKSSIISFGSFFNLIYEIVIYLITIIVLGEFFRNTVASLLLPLLLAFLLYIRRFIRNNVSFPIYGILLFFALSLLVATALQVSVDTWDYGELLRCAANYVLNGEMSTDYFAIYPNNKLWEGLLILYFNIIKVFFANITANQLYYASTVLSSALVVGGVSVIWKIIGKDFYNMLFILCCLPLWLYSTFAYTDTITFLLVALFIWIIDSNELEASDVSLKSYFIYAFIGFLAAFGYSIKPTFIICIIAFLCIKICCCGFNRKKVICIVLFAAVFLISKVSISNLCDSIIVVSEEATDRYETPASHYLMMGLNRDSNGGYHADDVAYTQSFLTYDEKVEANITEYKRRIKEHGVFSTIKFMLITKTTRTWANSLLNINMYLAREPLRPSLLHEFVIEDGRFFNITVIYSWIYYMIMTIGMFLSGFIKDDSGNNTIKIMRLTVVGVFIFYAFWECNSRYLFQFLPCMLLVSIDGWKKTLMRLKQNDTYV